MCTGAALRRKGNVALLEFDNPSPPLGDPPDPGAAPWAIQVQTAEGCNARCVMCPTGDGSGRGRTMDDALWERIVAGLDGVAAVAPYLMAEPLLDPHIERRVETLRTRWPALAVVLTTNGALLTEARARALVDAGVTHLTVSLYSTDPGRYRELTSLSLARVLDNVRAALPHARRAGVNFRLNALDGLLRDGEVGTLRERWGLDDGVAVDVSRLHDRAGSVALPEDLTFARHPANARPAIGCEARDRPWRMMHVLVDGRAVLCCSDWQAVHVLGDLRTETVADVWRGARYESLRAALRSGARSGVRVLCDTCGAARRAPPDRDVGSR